VTPDSVTPRNPLDHPVWPELPTLQSKKEDAQLERYKQQLAETSDRRKEFPTASHESRVAIEAAQIEVTKGGVERSRDSAKQIQVAASAIATLYTGTAALVFSIEKDQPLPIRGVIPVVFLGTAIVFATLYLAWIGPGISVRPFPLGIDATQLRVDRAKWFNDWVSVGVLRRAWALRLATLALAAGLVFLPAAFISVSSSNDEEAAGTEAADVIEWPATPTDDAKLEEILFTAKVEEAARLREASASRVASSTSDTGVELPEWLIWSAAGIVFASIWIYVLIVHKWGELGKAIKELTYRNADAE
jgi:hypothetical protein